MFWMYGTRHVPFSPTTRPRFTVPSARRGVGSTFPRPAAVPLAGGMAPSCAPAGSSATHNDAANTATAVVPRSAARRTCVTGGLQADMRSDKCGPGYRATASEWTGAHARNDARPRVRRRNQLGVGALARRGEQALAVGSGHRAGVAG